MWYLLHFLFKLRRWALRWSRKPAPLTKHLAMELARAVHLTVHEPLVVPLH